MNINFEKANSSHVNIIFSWLKEPFVQEFWDNTQAHKDDIVNFINGRTEPSSYADGKYVYWIASCDEYPFAMLMTIQETSDDEIDEIKLINLSKTGHSYGIDYMIGDKNYFGKGYGARTLVEFIDFFIKEVDPKADTFLIDPASDNPRAKHVYIKAGFEYVADFLMSGDVSGAGKLHHLLIKRLGHNIKIVPASLTNYPTIQNMARFYVYDRTAYMGWECPENGLFECIDFKHYFETPDEEASLIIVNNEIAGFVLLDKIPVLDPVDWNMGEFFVLAKFQGKGIANLVAQQIFNEHPGKWSVAVMSKNIKAVKFWRKIISAVSRGEYTEVFKTEDELRTAENPEPYAMNVFSFKTQKVSYG
ncbi:TPA: GNAT family N-acetyltransferase [Legionella pneumophila]|uniref:GNAT family N-acetyltransferase n=1 Tax=Legionella sp. PATHC039 TaxID=2992042 RepID=UPI000A7E60B1|nr:MULTISPECIES: GNAT family N-acetyltransferase [Legionella]HAT8859844.1 GNAT family N-acetyltransferase [Legionella pneumophila subsp. pneumophila]MCW8395844.1 GNAT family N-acetyltransferase [Legionella sp. PATHC039]HAT7072932.1 GNAT family N-acetyltransferase [Legionella pneumophila]HAT8641686.1 GNAT family N-acetyltransferase [Legionella pneumophila]HAT8867411.1 GNAT family N-acetyltransferase [Legionella pneumophila subsp. pneumophila]